MDRLLASGQQGHTIVPWTLLKGFFHRLQSFLLDPVVNNLKEVGNHRNMQFTTLYPSSYIFISWGLFSSQLDCVTPHSMAGNGIFFSFFFLQWSISHTDIFFLYLFSSARCILPLQYSKQESYYTSVIMICVGIDIMSFSNNGFWIVPVCPTGYYIYLMNHSPSVTTLLLSVLQWSLSQECWVQGGNTPRMSC